MNNINEIVRAVGRIEAIEEAFGVYAKTTTFFGCRLMCSTQLHMKALHEL
jgi:hypothetical protein